MLAITIAISLNDNSYTNNNTNNNNNNTTTTNNNNNRCPRPRTAGCRTPPWPSLLDYII